MPGRPDFSQPGSGGSGQTVAIQSRPEIDAVNADQTDTVGSGLSEAVEIYAPTGANYEVRNLTLQAKDTDGSNGSHAFEVRTAGRVRIAEGVSSYNDELRWEFGTWSIATEKQFPSSETATKLTEESLRATENSPIEITYKNNKDVDVDTDRLIRLTVEEVSY